MSQDLTAACQMFLIPATILFAALAAAPTEQLKMLISFMGLVTSGVWLWRIWIWTGLQPTDRNTTLALASVFTVAWFLCTIAHVRLWLAQKGASRN